MKKYMSMFLAMLMLAVLFLGCAGTTAESEPVLMRLGSLKGPTTMGMVKLISDGEAGLTANKYESTIVADASELMTKLIQGELDVLAMPVNACAVLSNKTNGGVTMLAVNTLGVLYILEKGGETVQSVADLKGKTIYATGKGNTPEYSLAYLLSKNGLDIAADVNMEWKSEATEVVAQLAAVDNAVALLPQPFVTVAQTKVEGLRVALDMTEEWNAVGSTLITGGLVIRTAFLQEHPEAVKTFLEEYAASTQYVNENVEEAAALVEQYIGVPAGVAKKAIPACNIVCLTGEEMKTAAQAYLSVLFELNDKAVGGQLPGDDFYYLP